MAPAGRVVNSGLHRIPSLDRLRGLVMILMALDHVRGFWGFTAYDPTDLAQTTPELFLTRWVTHFCAPVFVFLAGSSAWLYRGNRRVSARRLSWFLATRGMWLIFIELTIVTFSWRFSLDVLMLQVIWALGCSMLFLAALVFLPIWCIVVVGLTLVLAHNLFDGVSSESFGDWGWLWSVLHVQQFMPWDSVAGLDGVIIVYPLVPWLGVMALGYSFGAVLQMPAERRDALALRIGLYLIAAFLVLRGFNLYGDPRPWISSGRGEIYTSLSFFNTTKYPPSLLYLAMTLGPAIALIPLLERWHGGIADKVTVFGRAPFFFYLIHLPVIHLTVSIWWGISFGAAEFDRFDASSWPSDYSPSLIRVYAVWLLIVVLLYFPCRWFVSVRERRKDWWLSYL
jgi:uncharacterized membrane protein